MITVHRQKINHQEPKANRTKSPSGSMWKKKKTKFYISSFSRMKLENEAREQL